MGFIKKVLLLNSSIKEIGDKYNPTVNYSCYPPLGLVKIGSELKATFPYINVKIIDAEIQNFNLVKDQIKEFKPEILGISTLTSTYENALEISKYSKEVGVKYIVLGNDHVSFFPELILNKREYVDYVIQGENGGFDFCNLVAAIESNDFSETSNLFYREGSIVKQSKQIQKTSFNKILPDFNLLGGDQLKRYSENYNNDFGEYHGKNIFPLTVNNAQGCTNFKNHCLYCSIYSLKPEYGTPENLWELIKHYNQELQANLFFEVCDNFGGLKKYRKELVKSIPDWYKNSDIELIVYSRADNIVKDNDILDDFEKLHVKRIIVGLETGSEYTLKQLRKGYYTTDINKQAIQKIADYNFQLHASFILGALGETKDDLNKTISFIQWLSGFRNAISIEVSKLYPLPNSPAWDLFLGNIKSKFYNNIETELKKANLLEYKEGWKLANKNFSNKDKIDLNLANKIWIEYFTNISYTEIIHEISEINGYLESKKKKSGGFL